MGNQFSKEIEKELKLYNDPEVHAYATARQVSRRT